MIIIINIVIIIIIVIIILVITRIMMVMMMMITVVVLVVAYVFWAYSREIKTSCSFECLYMSSHNCIQKLLPTKILFYQTGTD